MVWAWNPQNINGSASKRTKLILSSQQCLQANPEAEHGTNLSWNCGSVQTHQVDLHLNCLGLSPNLGRPRYEVLDKLLWGVSSAGVMSTKKKQTAAKVLTQKSWNFTDGFDPDAPWDLESEPHDHMIWRANVKTWCCQTLPVIFGLCFKCIKASFLSVLLLSRRQLGQKPGQLRPRSSFAVHWFTQQIFVTCRTCRKRSSWLLRFWLQAEHKQSGEKQTDVHWFYLLAVSPNKNSC